MTTDSGLPVSGPPPGQPVRRRTLGLPSTRLGWWSVGLAAAFVPLLVITPTMTSMPEGTWQQAIGQVWPIPALLCGLAAGIVGLIAVIRRHERSWLVWLAMLPMLMVLFVVLAEFLAVLAGIEV